MSSIPIELPSPMEVEHAITPSVLSMENVIELQKLIWPAINETRKEITLYTYDDDPNLVRPFVIKPGERIIFPKQVQFLDALDKYDATLYGGAVGSGKSWILRWALIWLLIKWALPKDQGGYGLRKVKVGLFCETYTALEDRQIGDLKALPETLGTWNDKMKEFRLHDRLGGGIIKCRNLDEVWKYASVQFAAIAVDELTHNPETVYNFLRTRRRYPPIEHCPIIAASNPGNIGNSWVVERFVSPKTRVRPHYDEKLDYYSKGNYFIQSYPQDNPTLTKQYLADINMLPEKQRRALVLGDWTVYAGQYFSMLDTNIHFIPPFDIPETWSRFRAIDHGSAHPTVCLWGATDENGTLYIYREYSMGGEYATYHKRRIVEYSGSEQYRTTVGDPSMWSNEHSSEVNKMPAEVYNDPNDGLGSLRMVKANNARIQGWQALADGFSYELEGGRYDFDDRGRPQIKFLRKPRIYIFNTCSYTWDSLTNVQHDEARVEDVKKTKSTYGPGKGDDEAETLRYLNLAARGSVSEMLTSKPTGIVAPWTKNKQRGSITTAYARF
jgi:hypothetical protein